MSLLLYRTTRLSLGNNLDDDIASHNGLATKTAVQGKAGGQIQTIGFVVLQGRQIAVTLLHYNVARGAFAAAATRVCEWNPIVERNRKQRFRFAMTGVR